MTVTPRKNCHAADWATGSNCQKGGQFDGWLQGGQLPCKIIQAVSHQVTQPGDSLCGAVALLGPLGISHDPGRYLWAKRSDDSGKKAKGFVGRWIPKIYVQKCRQAGDMQTHIKARIIARQRRGKNPNLCHRDSKVADDLRNLLRVIGAKNDSVQRVLHVVQVQNPAPKHIQRKAASVRGRKLQPAPQNGLIDLMQHGRYLVCAPLTGNDPRPIRRELRWTFQHVQMGIKQVISGHADSGHAAVFGVKTASRAGP
ncbi:MAG: hypothetical protein ACRC14_01185 [Paracoccaceae bacterium]